MLKKLISFVSFLFGLIVESNCNRVLLQCVSSMLLMNAYQHYNSYTRLSWLLMVYALIDEYICNDTKSLMVPIMLNNFISLSIVFHCALLFEKCYFTRLALLYDCSIIKFHTVNIIIHICPIMVLSVIFIGDINNYKIIINDDLNAKLGVYSCVLQVSWCLFTVGGFDLSEVYIAFDNKEGVWNKLWIITIITHILSGHLIQWMII
jgi:hypothetical protein